MKRTTWDGSGAFLIPLSVPVGVAGNGEVQQKGSTSRQGSDASRGGDRTPAESPQGQRGAGQCRYLIRPPYWVLISS